MFADQVSSPSRNRGGKPSNVATASKTWGADMPRWVRLLAEACDKSNQKVVADRLGKSGGYVSRLINNCYPGDVAEAERLIRAAYGDEDVACPIWGKRIPLSSCMRQRRRKPRASTEIERLHVRFCPTCPNNTDRAAVTNEEID